MSNDIQTRDKQNRDVDSSEQYAINVIGDRALQSANLVVKESKRAVEKAMGGKSVLPLPNSKQNIRSSTPRQTPSVANAPPDSSLGGTRLVRPKEFEYSTGTLPSWQCISCW